MPFADALETLASAELGCGDEAAAETHFRPSILMARQLFYGLAQISCLGGFARLATARGDHVRALRLAAVVERYSEEWEFRVEPFWTAWLRVAVEESRSKLGPAKANSAWREGRAMELAKAVEYALEQH